MNEVDYLPLVGKTFQAEFEDCCIIGGFTSILVSVEIEDDEDAIQILRFQNGVYLQNYGQVKLTLLD
jgi:hypothetical protein